MERLLLDHQEEFITLINFMEDRIFVMKVDEGSVRYVAMNKAAEKRVNLTTTAVSGKKLEEILPLEKAAYLKRKYQEVIRAKQTVTFEYTMDEQNYEESKLNPILDEHGKVTYILAITRDITERKIVERKLKEYQSLFTYHSGAVLRNVSELKQLEAALIESEARYRLIAENSTELIMLLTVDQHVTYASPSHLKLLGSEPETLKGQAFQLLLTDEDRQPFNSALQQVVAERKHHTVELRLRHADGQWLWFAFDLIPIDDEWQQLKQFMFIGDDITSRKRYEEKMHELAFHDPLTGLPNRRLFMDQVTKAMETAERNQNMLAIFYLDCDNFKPLNDELGHDVGDQFLQELAQQLTACVRKTDMVARIGGDEFNILIPNIEDKEEVEIIAERIIAMMNQAWTFKNKHWTITASVGIAVFPQDGVDANTIIKKADQALYYVKEKGRNNYQWYDQAFEK